MDDASNSEETRQLLDRLGRGDVGALEALFSRSRGKLERMIRYRLDRRLLGRVDPDDVLQEAWLAAAQRIDTFRVGDEVEVLVWLRRITNQVLVETHRRHVGASMRSADKEAKFALDSPSADPMALSALLIASLTSPSGAAMRAETNARLVRALEDIDPIDREIVELRHFEELSNDEVAAVMGLTRSTASYRYIRTLTALKRALDRDGESTPS